MSLARTVRRLTDATQIVTPRYLRWLAENQDRELPGWVVDILVQEMKKVPRDRSMSFAGSSSGECLRAQELRFLGKPPTSIVPIPPDLLHLYNDGKFRHLKWQGYLLAATILDRIEVPAPWPAMYAMGSLDGLGTVDYQHPNLAWRGLEFGFELKGMNPFPWARAVKQKYPKEAHMRQIHRYFLILGLELFVVIYENKATNQWHEWVIRPVKQYMEESQLELEELNRAREAQQLHPMLPSCQIRRGKNWEECPFAGVGGTCERTKRWA